MIGAAAATGLAAASRAWSQTRNEDKLSGSLSVSYVPVRVATIDLGLQAGSRDSNIPVDDYIFHSVFVSVRADF